MQILGVDIGGSGIKGAIVQTETGQLISERHRIVTPQPATPNAVASVLLELVTHFNWQGPVGCGFPAAIQHGIARTASNISPTFIATDVQALFTETLQRPCYLLNDADAAGLAEMQFGEYAGHTGVILMITIGTGLGSALFTDTQLLPNTELGHIYLNNGKKGEHYASGAVRKNEALDWKQWGKRFNEYLMTLEALLWPDVIILGGGSSKKFDKFEDCITVKATVKPAIFLNQAGIVGAALYAHQQEMRKNEK